MSINIETQPKYDPAGGTWLRATDTDRPGYALDGDWDGREIVRLDGVPLEGDADTLAEAERLFLDAVSDEPESSWLEEEE